MKNRILLFTFLFFILITILSRDIPFFWSGTFFSEQAVTFFNSGFNGFITSPNVDTGGFPLYAFYLTIIWKLFGKTLMISHLALLPFLIGIAHEYYKLASRYFKNNALWMPMILLLFEPTFITQGILMAYDILLIYFFFLTLNSLLNNKKILFVIAATLLCLSNVRGIMMLTSLFIIDLILQYQLNNKIKWASVLKYTTPLLTLAFWSFYHYYKTSWYLFAPSRENNDESIASLNMMFHQVIYILLKVIDFGRLILVITIVTGGYFLFKKKQLDAYFKEILILIAVPLFVAIIFISPFANPVGHRYFMAVFLLLIIGACYVIKQITSRKKQIFVFIIICCTLLKGNFWLYPERLGNGWDSSLKVLPCFQLQEQMDRFIIENKIPATEIGSQFPLIADTKYSYLSDTSRIYTDVIKGPIENYRYYLQSNLINTSIPEQIEKMKKEWTLIKKVESGQVYLSLYRNDKK